MKKALKILKKHWILIWLIVAALAFVIVVQAEYYAEKNRVRRVVANVTSEGQLFSSNCLTPKALELKKIQIAGEGGYCVVPVNIWNYNPSNPQKAYQGDLPYKLTFRLVDATDNPIAQDALQGITLEYSTDGSPFTAFEWNAGKGSYYWETNKTFTKGVDEEEYYPDHHDFYLKFPDSVLDNDTGIYVEAIATPNDTRSFSTISAIIGIEPRTTMLIRGWKGSFYDSHQVSDYDAFNYVLTGNGASTITLEWCSDYLEINNINLSEYADDIDITSSDLIGTQKTIGDITGTWKMITINADADRTDGQGHRIGRNRYGFQFYMTADPNTAYGYNSGTTVFWETVEKYVNFTAN